MDQISVTVTQTSDKELTISWDGFWNNQHPDVVKMIGLLQAAVSLLSAGFSISSPDPAQ